MVTSSHGKESSDRRLTEGFYRHFSPLLSVSQEYAALSGCRFRERSFDGYADIGGCSALSERRVCSVQRRRAKESAVPNVEDFAKRLARREQALVEEAERAFRVVMAESVRNAMIGMFQELDMFPPRNAPASIDDCDCMYEDVTAPLPVIAQRLYNDESRRVMDEERLMHRRATTSAFVVDFVEAAGIGLPPIPETYRSMLQEFIARVDEAARGGGTTGGASLIGDQETRARSAFLSSMGDGLVAEGLKAEVFRWWAENRRKVLFGALGAVAVAVGVAALSGLARGGSAALAPSARRSDDDEEDNI